MSPESRKVTLGDDGKKGDGMTPERILELRRRSGATTPFESNIGFSGLGTEEALEMFGALEFLARLEAHLVDRRTMEPRHSREDHECPECVTLAELRASRRPPGDP